MLTAFQRRRGSFKYLRPVLAVLVLGWTLNTMRFLTKESSQTSLDVASALESSLQDADFVDLDLPVVSNSHAKKNHRTLTTSTEDWRKFHAESADGMVVKPPRLLIGIMTYDGKVREVDRRQMLRDTYLNYYKEYGDPATETHRICPIYQLRQGEVSWEDCQIAYAFVLGQSQPPFPPGNRTELLNVETTQGMIRHEVSLDPDVVPLDIVENGKFGKSPTWFRYANLLIDEEKWSPYVTHIVKTDSDTLVIPPRFLRWLYEKEAEVHYQRERIYGGVPLDKKGCGWPSHDHCANMTAPYFHGGALYLTTVDVSRYIVSQDCPRRGLFLPHEDVTMGNYVHSMEAFTGLGIQNFSHYDAYQSTWKHPVKVRLRCATRMM